MYFLQKIYPLTKFYPLYTKYPSDIVTIKSKYPFYALSFQTEKTTSWQGVFNDAIHRTNNRTNESQGDYPSGGNDCYTKFFFLKWLKTLFILLQILGYKYRRY